MNQKLTTKQLVSIAIGSIIIIFLFIFLFGGNSNTPEQTNSENDFSVQAMVRFNSLTSAIPELEAVRCEGGNCKYVVYFDFKEIPEDLETIIRGNTATFSKFKMDNTGVSNVTLAARISGNIIFSCQASKGIVENCE